MNKCLTTINSLKLTEREIITTKQQCCTKLIDLLRATLDHQTKQDLRHYRIISSSSPVAKGETALHQQQHPRRVEKSMAADRIMIYLLENNLINSCELADYLTETLKRCCTVDSASSSFPLSQLSLPPFFQHVTHVRMQPSAFLCLTCWFVANSDPKSCVITTYFATDGWCHYTVKIVEVEVYLYRVIFLVFYFLFCFLSYFELK